MNPAAAAMQAINQAIAERDAARAENMRLRALLHKVATSPSAARHSPFVRIDRETWAAICAIDARTEQVQP